MLNDDSMLDEVQDLDATAAAAEDYLEAAFGITLGLEPVSPANLPHFLLDRYRLWQGSLLGQPMLLAAGKGWKPGEGFTRDFLKQREILRDRLGVPLVILLLEHASAAARKQLVSRKIGFLAPASQLYVPEALLDLRERSARARADHTGLISPTAQLLLLAVLQGEPFEDANQTELAAKLGVAVMSISRALDELDALGIAKARRVGRQRQLHLLARGGELWGAVKDKLQSPVRKLRRVDGILDDETAPRSGESALAHYTMLGEPRAVHRAIAAAHWKDIDKRLAAADRTLEFVDAPIHLETWSYDPAILAKNGVVDPLSLYLSTRHSLDERVAQAAEQLLEPFGW
jgi:DNA-binding MarR family transcriptional regulator